MGALLAGAEGAAGNANKLIKDDESESETETVLDVGWPHERLAPARKATQQP